MKLQTTARVFAFPGPVGERDVTRYVYSACLVAACTVSFVGWSATPVAFGSFFFLFSFFCCKVFLLFTFLIFMCCTYSGTPRTQSRLSVDAPPPRTGSARICLS